MQMMLILLPSSSESVDIVALLKNKGQTWHKYCQYNENQIHVYKTDLCNHGLLLTTPSKGSLGAYIYVCQCYLRQFVTFCLWLGIDSDNILEYRFAPSGPTKVQKKGRILHRECLPLGLLLVFKTFYKFAVDWLRWTFRCSLNINLLD